MHILPPLELSVRRILSLTNETEPLCEIIRYATPTGRQVAGAVLEAAAEWQGFYLLFTTDDTPFEELLHIHLLDADLRMLDTATLGGIYSTGSFVLLESAQPDTFRFRFIGDTDWHIQILPAPSFRVPLLSEPTGVCRPLGFKRHFIVRGRPQPESGRAVS